MKTLIKSKFILFMTLVFCLSCEDFVEVDNPRTELVSGSIFQEESTAEAAVANLYTNLWVGIGNGSQPSITGLTSLMSDELIIKATQPNEYQEFYANNIIPSNPWNNNIWTNAYSTIYNCNSIIEGLENSPIPEDSKNQFLGEAKFVRAFNFFYLINLFGDVPLTVTTDYLTNNSLLETSTDEIYGLIEQDLSEAKQLLSEDYSYSSQGRTRVNKSTASALLARVYLYRQSWSSAEIEATNVINSVGLYSLENNPNLVFRTTSPEAIFQLWSSVVPKERYTFAVLSFYQGPNFGALRQSFVNSFEPGDLRFSNWINTIVYDGITYNGATKYKFSNPPLDFTTVLRLAEQYLIRAEARAQLGDLSGALNDLNIIRNRAGLTDSTASSLNEVIEEIKLERWHELFTEWGHRWFDLKRWGLLDETMQNLPDKDWQSTDALWPIPESQLISNPEMQQNPGY